MENLLLESRARGWAAAVTAPDWAKDRILEIRSAIIEKRSIPAPSRSFVDGCEKRSLGNRAVNFGRKLFGTNRTDEELKNLAHRQFQRIGADFRAEGLPVNMKERAAVNAAE